MTQMPKKIVEKAVAYITWNQRLLVFEHPGIPEAGIQVPGGTIHPGESPGQAALREAEEESGLAGLQLRSLLGVAEVDQSPWGMDAIHRRYFYHLVYDGDAPEHWEHLELDPSDGSPDPIRLEFYWVRYPEAVPELIAGLGDLLPRLGGNE